MRSWFAIILLFLTAVPYQTYWEDYETARRGVLALLVGIACFVPRLLPHRAPAAIWPLSLLALWSLCRCLFVTNTGYGLESACHTIALAVLLIAGTGMELRDVLRAALPTGMVVAGVGIAQSFGISLIPDTTEAVSTLGNRNVASEVLAVCGAAAALLASLATAGKGERRVALATLALCAVALALNGSRSGLLALPVAGLTCLLTRPFAAPRLAVATLAVALGVGFALVPISTRGAPPAAHAAERLDGTTVAAADLAPGEVPPTTTEVRLELWKGTAEMITAKPIFGFGGGQFRVEYPRYRRLRELELSSYYRRFQTSPDTAHNDYLQVFAELGILGLVLASLTLFFVLRRGHVHLWGPILAFLILAGVRAPLTNAPVAALVFLFAGALLRHQHREGDREFSLAPRRQLVKRVACGLLLGWFGAAQLLSQIATTGYVSRVATTTDYPGAMASVEQVLRFRPHDHDFRLLRARENLKKQTTLRAARRDIEYLLRTASALPAVQIEYAQLLNAEDNPDGALKVLNELRAIRDPENQRAIQVTVAILVRRGRARDAIQVLYESRHRRTRESLARVLAGLAKEAKTTADRQRLSCEAAFVATIDELIRDPKSIRVMDTIQRFAPLAAQTDAGTRNMRYFVLHAAALLGLGQKDEATALAGLVRDRSLPPAHRRLLEPVLQPLLAIAEWRERLGSS